MRRVTIKQLSQDTDALLDAAQMERVLITQNGKPVAVILGLKFKDEEDYALERDAAFWQMIRERRRNEKTIPLEQVKKELGLDTPKKERKRKVAKAARG